MENLKVGDIVYVKSAKDLHIVVSHIKGEEFQGVYFSSYSQEFKTTPMMSVKVAVKVEQEKN